MFDGYWELGLHPAQICWLTCFCQAGGFFSLHIIRCDFLHISHLTFQKTHTTHIQQCTVRHKLPGKFKKGVQLVWRRTFLIYTLTEEDSSNDAAFDLAPLDNVPPYPRQVRCLSKAMRTFFSTANVSEDVSDSRAHLESHGVLQISIFLVHVCYCSWTNDAETERRAVFNQYKRLTLLWPKLQACFGNTERMQSKRSWKPFYSQAKTQFFQICVFQIFHNTDTWSPKPHSRPLIIAWKTSLPLQSRESAIGNLCLAPCNIIYLIINTSVMTWVLICTI